MTEDRLLPRRDVEARTGLSKTTIYRLMRDGQFPLPRKLGGKAVRWSQADLEAWIAEQPLATGEAVGQ